MKQKLEQKEIVENGEGIRMDHESKLVVFDGFTHNGRLYNHLSALDPPEWNPALHKIIDKGLIVENASKSYDFEKGFELHQTQMDAKFNQKVSEVKEILEKFSKENMENVNKEINEVSKEFDIKNKDSKMSKSLEDFQKKLVETYGKDSWLYNEFMQIFSTEKEGSPLNLFLKDIKGRLNDFNEHREKEVKEIKEQISKVKESLEVKKKAEELLQKSTQKGQKHEDNIDVALRRIAEPYGDTVLDVSRTRGSDNRNIGDFEVDLSCDGSISIEAKDENGKSANQVQKEIRDTVSNRKCDFVIYAFKNNEQIPVGVEKFTIQKNAIICSVEDNQLYLAYRLARKLVEIKQNEAETDFKALQGFMEDMRHESKVLKSMKTNASNLVNTSAKVKESLVGFIARYEERLDNMLKTLNNSDAKVSS